MVEALLGHKPLNMQKGSLVVKEEETIRSMLVTLIKESQIQCYFNFSRRYIPQSMRLRSYVTPSPDSQKDMASLSLVSKKSLRELSKKCKVKCSMDAPLK